MAIVVKGKGFPLTLEYAAGSATSLVSADLNGGNAMAITSAGLLSAYAFSGDIAGAADNTNISATNLTAGTLCGDTMLIGAAGSIYTPSAVYVTSVSAGSATYAGGLTAGSIYGGGLTATTITATLLTASNLSSNSWVAVTNASATNFTAGVVSATNMCGTSITTPTIKGANITADVILATTFTGSTATSAASSTLSISHGGSATLGAQVWSAHGFLQVTAYGKLLSMPAFSGGVVLS